MKKIISGLIACFILMFFLVNVTRSVNALEMKRFNIGDKELYNETNTYTYKDSYQPNEDRYDFNSKTNIVVDDNEPLLTVFTHGLQGSASHWSNNENSLFSYSKDSIITRMAKITDSNIYWVKIDGQMEIRDITDELYDSLRASHTHTNYSGKIVRNITDISKHSIILFEASETATAGRNDAVYDEFNYAISQLVYDIRVLNNGLLPKINLIGHSRGGITNMQYALDHPDLVHSMYSLGTPYTGSTSASLDRFFFNFNFSGSKEASEDITSKSVYGKYMDRWNSNYETRYSHINVMALAGKATLLQIAGALTTEHSLEYLQELISDKTNGKVNIDKTVLMAGIYTAIVSLNLNVLKNPFGVLTAIKTAIGIYSELAKVFDLTDVVFDDVVQILANEINFDYHPPFLSWYNDGLVDLGSQLGYEGLYLGTGEQYLGFKRVTKTFMLSNSEFNNTSMTLPAVAHNLEARDKELGTYILSDISMGIKLNNDYETYEVGNNEIGIGSYIGKPISDTLVIPTYINGKKVVAIGDYAFANNAYGQVNLTKVVIPKTVISIGKNAFYNSENITSITFENNSGLLEIDKGAFSYMPNLTSFDIPNGLHHIGESAFLHSGISNFNIPNNRYYSWENNFLIDKDTSNINTQIAIYANPNVTEFIVPSKVKILSPYIFENNQIIQKIDLNNVEHVGLNTFSNSTLTVINGGQNLKNTDDNAFSNTPWLENQNSDFITLGMVLIQYNGEETDVVIPEGIKKISGNSFNSNLIKNIILPTTLENIGKDAFTKCLNLESILFKSTRPAILDGTISSSDVELFVSEGNYNYYINSIYYSEVKNQIKVKPIIIDFFDENGNKLGSRTEKYGSSFDQAIEAPKIKGMDFLYWFDEDGKIYHLNSYLDIYEDIKLYPKYEESKYTLNIFNDQDNSEIEITYGSVLKLDVPRKDGYEFIGWYDSENNGNQVINASGEVVWYRTNEVEYLYARYEIIEYTIEYVTNQGEFVGGNRYTFTVENPITTNQISEVRRFGYIFDYWRYNDKEFKTTFGIYKDIRIEAKWLGERISRNLSGTIAIGDEYVIIDLQNASRTSIYLYKIAATVKSVTFIGDNREMTNMSIEVASRSTALIMGFDSMDFRPKQNINGRGFNAIDASSNFELYIIYKNHNKIVGGLGGNGLSYYRTENQAIGNSNGITGKYGGAGSAGGTGIYATKVTFSEYDNKSWITVVGGNGGNGGRGGDGQYGSNGVQNPNGSWLKPKKGDNGARGGNGGTGGAGGEGGLAIRVVGKESIKVSTISNYRFTGGAGGNGGQGGSGGNGGTGASDTSTNIWNGVGDPGDGGNGGNGGSGGRGGNGSAATNALYVFGVGGAGGSGGSGNSGGYGGSGGDAGSNGADGNNGSSGSMGSYGSTGSSGTTGYNTEQTSSGVRNISYAFDKLFIALYV
ncbi:alpha/beta fold hydrolase [Haploplasma axanthum]|uniref:Alpha/beta hydrolase fold n=1 Tax=Haploplasma axanthum TaxID=29552 RepID=A0A449BEI2_HAPAX|nr:alpha/beta fold hydrolase [Haploplasma axanthum]VEU80832.1 alpha/beta hydrolase fold [Haploplasma axanthum]